MVSAGISSVCGRVSSTSGGCRWYQQVSAMCVVVSVRPVGVVGGISRYQQCAQPCAQCVCSGTRAGPIGLLRIW